MILLDVQPLSQVLDRIVPHHAARFAAINGDSFNSASTPQLATIVIPAKAGIQCLNIARSQSSQWMPDISTRA